MPEKPKEFLTLQKVFDMIEYAYPALAQFKVCNHQLFGAFEAHRQRRAEKEPVQQLYT